MAETELAPAPRPRRSDATKAAILKAARDRFAADGYDRATIRAIARDAAIDPAMVMRYYGSKEGLFAAASEFELRLPDLTRVPRARAGETLVRHFLARWETDEVFNALLRVGLTNATGAERIHRLFGEKLLPAVAPLCPDPRQAQERAALVAAQIVGMALTRYVLRIPAAAALPEEAVVAWLAPTVQRYMTAARP